MRLFNRILLGTFFVLPILVASPGAAQTETNTQGPAASTPSVGPQEANIKAYIELLRSDVRQQKAEIMGSVMVLSADDAAKFWPIYSEYEAQLNKLNDQRVANIREYVRSYNEMTDQKADELIRNAMAYQRQRSELVEKTYERMKQALGGVTAARFVQVESQLLHVIDLRIASALPIVGSGS